MAYDLTNLPGNFLTDGYSFEGFEFEEGAGDFAGLVVPARTIAIDAANPAVPITRGSGKRGRGVVVPDSATQFLEAGCDDTWNALAATYDWLVVCLWFKQTAALGTQAVGITGAAGLSQWYIDMGEMSIGVVNSADAGPTIDSGVTPMVGVWHFVAAQFHYDGSGAGVSLKLHIDGTDYATITGSTAITPNFPATDWSTTLFEVASASMQIDQLLFWKSAVNPLDATSIAALYNGGAGISFLPGTRRRIAPLLATGII